MPKMVSPTGSTIVGTREVVYGTCGVDELSFFKDASGKLQFEYDGNGTKLDWNSQKTVKVEGHRVFIDDDGEAWEEYTLRFDFGQGR